MRIRTSSLLTAACLSLAIMMPSTVSQASSRVENGLIVVVADTGNGASWQLYTVDPRDPDKPLMQLTHLAPNPSFSNWIPQFSPDGKWLAFMYQSPNEPSPNGNVYIAKADGSDIVKVTSDNQAVTVAWSADGSRLLLSDANTKTGVPALNTIAINGSRKKSLTDDLFSNTSGFSTPDGRTIIFTSEAGGVLSAAWSMDVDGSDKRRLTTSTGNFCTSAVSPDGTTALMQSYCRNAEAFSSGIWAINVDGTHARQLTHPGPGVADGPATYSPNGMKITFFRVQLTSGIFDLWVMNADGSAAKPLKRNCNCFFPTWGQAP